MIEYDIMGGINNVHKIGFAYIYLATMFYLFNRDHAVRNQVNIIQLLVECEFLMNFDTRSFCKSLLIELYSLQVTSVLGNVIKDASITVFYI